MKTNQFTELQEKWLNLMETTDLEQGKAVLRKGNKYCCLGLAAEFILGIEPEEKDSNEVYIFDGATGILISGYQDLNLISEEGIFSDHIKEVYPHNCLIAMNDDGDYTFKEIASFIRKYPWAVFTNFERPAN